MDGTKPLSIQTQRKSIHFEKVKFCHPQQMSVQNVKPLQASHEDGWPKGPYTQKIEGVLPAILTDDIITVHLQSSGKQLNPKRRRVSDSYSNIDYSTLQRGHQYFMESYIPGKHVRFCCKQGQVWVRARCYRSQKRNDPMHRVNGWRASPRAR